MVFNKAAIIAFLGLIALPAAFAAPLAVSGAGGSNSAAGYPTNAPDRYSGPWHAFPGKDTWVDFNLMVSAPNDHSSLLEIFDILRALNHHPPPRPPGAIFVSSPHAF